MTPRIALAAALAIALLGLAALATQAGAQALRAPDGRPMAAPEPPAYLLQPPARDEALQGVPNFRRVASLPASDPDRALGTRIGHLRVDQGEFVGLCTGSLIGPDIFLTNSHCVTNTSRHDPPGLRHQAGAMRVYMEYMSEGDLGAESSQAAVTMVLKDGGEFLDYAILQIEPALGLTYGWLEVETDPAAIDAVEAVKIIQHPAGRPKEIVTEDTRVVARNALALHYLADTEGGSSGSPVFPLGGETIIALHHRGAVNSHNEGVKMSLIGREIALQVALSEFRHRERTGASEADVAAAALGAWPDRPAPPRGAAAGAPAPRQAPAAAASAPAPLPEAPADYGLGGGGISEGAQPIQFD